MALSFAEKRTLQKEIQSCLASLAEGPDFKTKRTLQKRLAEAFAKLEGSNGNIKETLLDRILSGEFLHSTVEHFLKILEAVGEEISGDYRKLHAPIISFLDAHKSEIKLSMLNSENGGILESAMEALYASCPSSPTPASQSNSVRIMPGGMEFGSPQTIIIDIDTEFDSPQTFREIIRVIEQARKVDTLILKINSHGGRTDSAQAIYVALLETQAKTIAKIITAYSSGSIVAMACDELKPTPHCTMMIHNASGGAWGKIGDMKTQSTFMENHFKKWFNELYSGFLSSEEIEDVFKGQDIWLREEDINKRLLKWHPVRERRSLQHS